ncbi:uncharacterized protein G2W53_040015 [Senna tora]|uniref:Uncharacterized protein n=1 Tax=Senna tora TaxID=362788 RepID=A0A834T264_9FABA|nr:uncharacterized protein G2W53_040015 [Senna tora]
MSDCLETSCEASFCHRLHFDPAYAREILSRKKVYPCVIDFCTAPTVGDPRRRPSRIWPRPGFILTRHMHVGFGRDHEALIYALHGPTGVFTLSKLNDRVNCGTCAPLTWNLGAARATAETSREVALGAKLMTYNRVPVCPLRCARFASGREKTCTSDRFDAWDLE